MSAGMEPSPRTTLVILLGASEWPFSSLQSSPAFAKSANKIRGYFCDPHLFGLPPENLLDLFDKRQDSPYEVDRAICAFLEERISQMEQTKAPAVDLLFYYVGHGMFALRGDQAYHLAIRCTREDSLRASAIAMATLADTLKTKARHLRRIVILDCCFAAEALRYMQSPPGQLAIKQTMSAFEGHGFPMKGTALLCSSGHKQSSFILHDESGTVFSEALLLALLGKNKSQTNKAFLSLYDLECLTEDILKNSPDAPRPEIHSPDQSYGDVANVPFFPNLYVRKEQARLNEEKLLRKAEATEPIHEIEESEDEKKRREHDIDKSPPPRPAPVSYHPLRLLLSYSTGGIATAFLLLIDLKQIFPLSVLIDILAAISFLAGFIATMMLKARITGCVPGIIVATVITVFYAICNVYTIPSVHLGSSIINVCVVIIWVVLLIICGHLSLLGTGFAALVSLLLKSLSRLMRHFISKKQHP